MPSLNYLSAFLHFFLQIARNFYVGPNREIRGVLLDPSYIFHPISDQIGFTKIESFDKWILLSLFISADKKKKKVKKKNIYNYIYLWERGLHVNFEFYLSIKFKISSKNISHTFATLHIFSPVTANAVHWLQDLCVNLDFLFFILKLGRDCIALKHWSFYVGELQGRYNVNWSTIR